MKKVSHRFPEDLPPNDDEKTVAALDTEYQAAVLAHDDCHMPARRHSFDGCRRTPE